MKIKDFVAFLQGLDQEADLLVADYYYEDREGFSSDGVVFSDHIKRPSESRFNQDYKGNVYLLDFRGVV